MSDFLPFNYVNGIGEESAFIMDMDRMPLKTMIFFVFFTVSILFFCLHNYFNSGTYLTCVLLTACRTLVTSLDESVYWLFTGLNCHLFVIK